MTPSFASLASSSLEGKTAVVRMDLNVPMRGNEVQDTTRILRQLPTVRLLQKKGAKIVILSHLGRPEGTYVPALSLAPLVDTLADLLKDTKVSFGVDCVGKTARHAVQALQPGDVVLLENLRFHREEEANDPQFAVQLAALGDVYVNDAFSCAHRAHASIPGIAEHLPAYAGILMQEELDTLHRLFQAPQRPVAAIVGGSKISTKLTVLEHLLHHMDHIMIGGAMAHTFVLGAGYGVGTSLVEADMVETARSITQRAQASGCRLHLPVDYVTAPHLSAHAHCHIAAAHTLPEAQSALDIGPRTINAWGALLRDCRSVVWNGPVGAFEVPPFDVGTSTLARIVADLSARHALTSVAGGGDTVAALRQSGMANSFSYLSTAGGAFLEWLEGKELPGVAALQHDTPPHPQQASQA